LRGNVNTRLAKLDAGDHDAIILAVAGLKRLGLAERVRSTLDETIPAICQGILAIEYAAAREEIGDLLAAFELSATACAARAERALGLVVEGSCDVPVGALARVDADTIMIEGFIGMPDGTRVVRASAAGPCDEAARLGTALGEKLLAAGGREILKSLVRVDA
jgi:hydroxymethylbilane synthase